MRELWIQMIVWDILGNTLLHISVDLQDEKMVNVAIQAGADPFIENFQGKESHSLFLSNSFPFFLPVAFLLIAYLKERMRSH